MSRFFGDNSRRPASAGGSSKPFGGSSKATSNNSIGQPAAPGFVPSTSTPTSPLSRQTAQTSSPRSLGSSSGLNSEGSWSSLGSVLSSVPSSTLSSSPNSNVPNKSSSFSPKRPSTAPAKHYESERLPPLQIGSSVGGIPLNGTRNPLQSRSKYSSHGQALSVANSRSVRQAELAQSLSAGQPEFAQQKNAAPDQSSSRMLLSSKGVPPQRQKELQSSLTLPYPIGSTGIATRHSGDFSATDSSRSLHDSRPSTERVSNSSSRKDGDVPPQSESLFGLPYGQKSTIFLSPDRPCVITSGPGYQIGNENSSDWSFFSRSNWSSPPDHPFPPDKVPYAQGYDSRLLDYRYIRYQAARREGCMLPWSEKKEFKGFRPNRALDVGCEISAPWIFEAAEIWAETHFVGMDTAPVLIPPSRYPVQSASRISFVQANFLEIWPFEDDSFDFVRIAFAGDSIPEDLWHHVFDEATRVLNKNGWIQCIDDLSIITPPVTSPIQTSASLQRGESKFQSTLPIVSSSAPVLSTLANLEATKLLASDEPEGIEPHTAVQDKLNAFRKALESMDDSFQKRMMSLYRTSIFPAAMVLSCQNIISQGPVRVGLGVKEVEQTAPAGLLGAENIDSMMFVDAMAGAMDSWASTFRDSLIDSSNEISDLRAQADLEKSWRILAGTVRNKSDITSLLSKQFGWTCQTDEFIENALEKQVVAVELERQSLLASQHDSVDEYKMTEVDRALRDVKADLAATRRRLGRKSMGGGRDSDFTPEAMAGMAVGSEFVIKTGRKAA